MCIICIYIRNYIRFSGWLFKEKFLHSLDILYICEKVKHIPSFIKNLNISKCSISNNNHLKNLENLPNLKELIIFNSTLYVNELHEDYLPNLSVLQIYNSKITILPYFPNLIKLECINCPNIYTINNYKNLEVLKCINMNNLLYISSMKNLHNLYLHNIPLLELNIKSYTLQNIEIENCLNLNNIYLSYINNNIYITIKNCSNLLNINFNTLKIYKNLYKTHNITLFLNNCPKLKNLPSPYNYINFIYNY